KKFVNIVQIFSLHHFVILKINMDTIVLFLYYHNVRSMMPLILKCFQNNQKMVCKYGSPKSFICQQMMMKVMKLSVLILAGKLILFIIKHILNLAKKQDTFMKAKGWEKIWK